MLGAFVVCLLLEVCSIFLCGSVGKQMIKTKLVLVLACMRTDSMEDERKERKFFKEEKYS